MTRRRFLQGLAVTLAAAIAATWWPGERSIRVYAERWVDRIWSPSRRLRSHFSYLDLDLAGVDEYVKDYEHHVGRLSRFRRWPEDVYTRYLMSTDFFAHGADESRRVKYLMFYGPYVTLCYNPLARLD